MSEQQKREKTLIIEDPTLKRGFTSIPNCVLFAPGLSMPAKCLYSIILAFAWQDDECFPGQERLAESSGCTDRTIRKYLDELRDYGLISWIQRGLNQTNIYYIHDLSKVKRLKALSDKDRKERSGPDRKGSSGQDRKELSDKEYSDQYVVVVEAPRTEKIENAESASSTVENDGAVFDLSPAVASEMQGIEQGINHETFTDREEKAPDEPPVWEQIRSKVGAVAGVDISVSFAKEILGRYPPEKVSSVLKELRRQLAEGIEIRGVGAWLRYALENDIQPDKPAKINTNMIQKREENNNRTPRARPGGKRQGETPEEKLRKNKKKNFIKTLYT
ncbi:MAG: hypothetical protein A4E53_00400 [Pelotomaculum sp. PtaB.Bin104]|nr:MAG: hypothetical protein A4E53_00400 [Pelotomaculum sp. PtaB.Bin104]